MTKFSATDIVTIVHLCNEIAKGDKANSNTEEGLQLLLNATVCKKELIALAESYACDDDMFGVVLTKAAASGASSFSEDEVARITNEILATALSNPQCNNHHYCSPLRVSDCFHDAVYMLCSSVAGFESLFEKVKKRVSEVVVLPHVWVVCDKYYGAYSVLNGEVFLTEKEACFALVKEYLSEMSWDMRYRMADFLLSKATFSEVEKVLCPNGSNCQIEKRENKHE